MPRPARALALALALFFVIPVSLAQEPASSQASVCAAGLQTMDGVGLVCRQPSGLFEVFSPGLQSLGFIHGTDPAPAGSEIGGDITPLGSTSVNCVSGAAGTYFIQVIYARAADDADRYATQLPKIRTLTGNANALVDDAGLATGQTAALNVKCASGAVEVRNEVLPTAMANASFSTIVADLRAKGHNDGKVKYWVFYDDTGACNCSGTGHIYGDDSAAASNLNNGNGASMFAVNFGYDTSTRVWLHELAHNMGAVQNSAPHTTLAGHCVDGRDTMCYMDGGNRSANYTTTACSTEVFDCGKDDYFHAAPPAGSYLSTRWNLGSSVNRFIKLGGNQPPTMTTLTCSPTTAETATNVTCSFRATDADSTGLYYTVSWGDGSTSTVPAGSWVAPGTTRTAAHAYATTGTKTVSVTATDNHTLTSSARTANVTVVHDKTVPALTVVDPEPGFAYVGCSTKEEIPVSRSVWVTAGCVRATATDARSGVKQVEVYVDGLLFATDTAAPYELEVPVGETAVGVELRIDAIDHAGNRASTHTFVDTVSA